MEEFRSLTMTSIHRTSLIEPRQPRQEISSTKRPVIMRTYAEPTYRFEPNSSFVKDLSTMVQIPRPVTINPPNCGKIISISFKM